MKQLPNIITLSRVAFLGILAWLAFERFPGAATLTFFLSLVAAVSDWLDGYIARRFNLITDFGKLMDALVDKVMVVGLFLVLLYANLLAHSVGWLETVAWVIIAATVARDLLITGLRMAAVRKGVVLAADTIGKRKTIWQITAICVLFFVPVLERDVTLLPRWVTTWVWMNGVLYFLLGGVLTIYSGTLYVLRYLPLLAGRAAPAGGAGR